MKRKDSIPRRRGIVVIVVIAVLAALSMLATVFSLMARTERAVSRNYLDRVRASLLAHAGVELALSRLRSSPLGAACAYGGEDLDGDGDLTEVEDDENGNDDGTLQISACPLECARRPSFFADANADGLPDLIPIRGDSTTGGSATRLRGYTGALAATYEPLGDTFVVRVVDTGSRVYLNGTGQGYRRLYDNLGRLLLGRTLGAVLQAGQPYQTPEELVARGVLSVNEFRSTRDYWTTCAWVDPSTVKPDPYDDPLRRPELLRFAAGREPRAPINVNQADRAVLHAVFEGIAGYVTDPSDPLKSLYMLDRDRAVELATAIVAARSESFTDANGNGRHDPGEAFVDVFQNGRYEGPFLTWDSFGRDFLPRVPGFQAPSDAPYRDLVLANANPNTLLNRFVPDEHLWHSVDKADLVAYTTELCFQGGGLFEVAALGRVTADGGTVVAVKEVRVVVRLYDILKLTTQEDFESPSVRVAVSDDVVTLPEEVNDIALESYVDADGNGRYTPGEVVDDQDGDGARDGPALYDGQISLRPTDPSERPPWGGPDRFRLFRSLYNDSLTVTSIGPDSPIDPFPSMNRDVGGGWLGFGPPIAPMNIGDLQSNADNGQSLLEDLSGANDYSDLFPDGRVSQEGANETVYFDPSQGPRQGDGTQGKTGSIQFWLKPTVSQLTAALGDRELWAMNYNDSYDPGQLKPYQGRMYEMNEGMIGTLESDAATNSLLLHALWYEWSAGYIGYSALPSVATDRPLVSEAVLSKKLDAGGLAARQWHTVALRFADKTLYTVWLDGERIDGLPAAGPGAETIAYIPYDPFAPNVLTSPTRTYNLQELGAHLPWTSSACAGTIDDWVHYLIPLPSENTNLDPPWRYSDTGFPGWSEYVGRIALPPGARVRQIAWTRYLPVENYRGEALTDGSGIARRLRPTVSMACRLEGELSWHIPAQQDGRLVDPALPRSAQGGEGLQFRLTFDRNGQDPFRNSPVVDDVTILYAVDGKHPCILSWQETP